MATETQELKRELVHIRKDLDDIKNILREDFELIGSAKKALKEARKTPEEEYVDLEGHTKSSSTPRWMNF